ncbi:hypothetical protein KM043_012223 [Ampulex compressa]|nr:hypothetical protein KM043_012223 [Ampulex compressa]
MEIQAENGGGECERKLAPLIGRRELARSSGERGAERAGKGCGRTADLAEARGAEGGGGESGEQRGKGLEEVQDAFRICGKWGRVRENEKGQGACSNPGSGSSARESAGLYSAPLSRTHRPPLRAELLSARLLRSLDDLYVWAGARNRGPAS